MTRRRYTITIHISRKNKVKAVVSGVAYLGMPSTRLGDTIRFLNQKVIIEAERSLSYKDSVILENRANSLYALIEKSLLYLYAKNGQRIYISRIDIKRGKGPKTSFPLDYKSQPVNDFPPFIPFPDNITDIIWEESTRGHHLRVLLTHFLSGSGARERHYKYESLWRCFEQLSMWHYLHGVGKPNDFEAMKLIRAFIVSNPSSMAESMALAGGMTTDRLHDEMDWYQYVANSFPNPGSAKDYANYGDYFVGHYSDERIMELHKRLLWYREECLRNTGVLSQVQSHLTRYTTPPHNHQLDEEVVAFICCKYCYFLRNKLFHGEIPEFTFRIYHSITEDKTVDILNEYLSAVVKDLLNSFTSL